MEIKPQIYSFWAHMDDEFTVLSLTYGRILNYNIDKGFYVGVTMLNFYIGLNIRTSK